MPDIDDAPGVGAAENGAGHVAEGAKHAAGGVAGKLGQRLGPLPVWGWAVVAVGGFVAWGFIGRGTKGSADGGSAAQVLPGAARTPGAGGGGSSAGDQPSGLSSPDPNAGLLTAVLGAIAAIPRGVTSAVVPSATDSGRAPGVPPVNAVPSSVPGAGASRQPYAPPDVRDFIPAPAGASRFYAETGAGLVPISGTGVWTASPDAGRAPNVVEVTNAGEAFSALGADYYDAAQAHGDTPAQTAAVESFVDAHPEYADYVSAQR